MPHYQLGLLQNEHLNQSEKAIETFDNVLEKAPEHPFANYDLALIYHSLGDKEKALQFYEKAAEINPDSRAHCNASRMPS